MKQISPPPQADFSSIKGLIELALDPKAAKKHIEEIEAAAENHKEILGEMISKSEMLSKKEKELNEKESALKEKEDYIRDRLSKANLEMNSAVELKAEYSLKLSELNSEKAKFDSEKSSLFNEMKMNMNKAIEEQKFAEDRMQKAESLIAEYESKLGKLKAAMGG